MRIIGLLIARMSSRRLAGKVLMPVLGRTLTELQLERYRRASSLDSVAVATSTDLSDDPIARLADTLGIGCYRGPLDDVLGRILGAAREFGADHVVRIGGDCPFLEWRLVDRVVGAHLADGNDFTSNVFPPTYPDGLDMEVYSADCLARLDVEAELPSAREHISPFVAAHPDRYRIGNVESPRDLSHVRLTVDEPEDLEVVRRVFEALYPGNPDFTLDDILGFLEKRPEIMALNARFVRNEGAKATDAKDKAYLQERGRGG